MGNNSIKMNGNDLRLIVAESVKRVLKEWQTVMDYGQIRKGFVAGKDAAWKKRQQEKQIEQHPDWDPDGFIWLGDILKHNEKKKRNGSDTQRIPKPEGMSDIEFITRFAPMYNKRLAAGLKKMREYSGGEEELWEPLNVGHIRSGDVAEEFSNRYYVSNFGGIALSNPAHTGWCHAFVPYFDKSTKQFQINLRIYDAEGNEIDHLCPAVASLVRRVFGDEAANNLKAIERMKLKQGEAIMSGEETDF